MTKLETDEVEMYIYTPVGQYFCLSMDVNRNRFKEVDLLEGEFIPAKGAGEPTAGTEVHVSINGTKVFTGQISQVKKMNSDDGKKQNKGAYRFNVINSMYKLMNEKTNIDITDPTPVSQVVEESIKGLDVRAKVSPSNDVPIRMERNNAVVADILDDLAKKSNSIWKVDSYDVLDFGKPEIEEHELELITDTSAGKQTPPYRSVRVLGDNIVSRDGWNKRYMTGDTRVISEWHIEQSDDGSYSVAKGIGEQPIFPYKDKEIQTQEQADNIGENLANDLAKQAQGGWINVVGREDIGPLDYVSVPEFLGGETYLVAGTIHTLTDSDGYKTRITCGGIAGG